MAKATAYLFLWILIIEIIGVVDINVRSNNNTHSYYDEAYAANKTVVTSPPMVMVMPLISPPIQAKDTFSAIGTINSLVITIPESGFNITDAFNLIF